jgi:hypothetical protein
MMQDEPPTSRWKRQVAARGLLQGWRFARYVLRRDGVLQDIIGQSPSPAGVLIEERLSLLQV